MSTAVEAIVSRHFSSFMIFNTYSIGAKLFYFFPVLTFIDMTTKDQRGEATCTQVTWFFSRLRVHFDGQSSLLECIRLLFKTWKLVAVLLKLSAVNLCIL